MNHERRMINNVTTEGIILFSVYFRNGSGWASEQRELQQRQPEQRWRRVRDRKCTPQWRYVTSHIGPIGATSRAGDSVPRRVIKRIGGSSLRVEAGEDRPMEIDVSSTLRKHSEKVRGGTPGNTSTSGISWRYQEVPLKLCTIRRSKSNRERGCRSG